MNWHFWVWFINTHEDEKAGITLISFISSNWLKLSTVNFKGKKKGRKKEKLLIQIIVKKKIFALYQVNSWTDKSIFLYWLENLFFNKTLMNNITKKYLF